MFNLLTTADKQLNYAHEIDTEDFSHAYLRNCLLITHPPQPILVYADDDDNLQMRCSLGVDDGNDGADYFGYVTGN